MKFCSNCGKELMDDMRFCDSCGTAVAVHEKAVSTEEVVEKISMERSVEENTINASNVEAVIAETVPPVKEKKKFVFSKKFLIISGAVLAALIIAAVIIGNVVSLNMYKEKLELAYDKMNYGAQRAEDYASLESKVWRNCIYEDESAETDKYTKDSNGKFYDDFNDALSSFYKGEALRRIEIYNNVSDVDTYMSELKDCPDKFEDEYRVLKELYVAYSGLTDLVVGDSSYSYNSFSEALESARSNYKSALSSARLLIG